MTVRIAVFLVAAAVSGDDLLERARSRMAEHLTRLPNYVCTETIERSIRPKLEMKFYMIDRVRLEIAFVDRKELVSWPGEAKFEERGVHEMINHAGAVGSGEFGGHMHNLFRTKGPVFSAPRVEEKNGRRAVRWEFEVPRERSGWTVETDLWPVRVGYRGTVWMDAETLDPIRYEAKASDVPAGTGVTVDTDVVEYARVRIGEGEFAVPSLSELMMTDTKGNTFRNRVQFSGCRQYGAESSLRFDEGTQDSANEPLPSLPPGTRVEAETTQAFNFSKLAVGDRIEARIRRKDATVALPEGAVLVGRVTRFSRQPRWPVYLVGVRMTAIEAGSRRVAFRGVPDRSQARGRMSIMPGTMMGEVEPPAAGEWVLTVFDDGHPLKAGMRMTWRVAAE